MYNITLNFMLPLQS